MAFPKKFNLMVQRTTKTATVVAFPRNCNLTVQRNTKWSVSWLSLQILI